MDVLQTRHLLDAHQIRLKKSLGQNFLIDEPTAQKIVAALDIEPGDCVLEIGPGVGVLSQIIARSYRPEKLLLWEIDGRLVEVLKKQMSDCPNVEILQGDILKSNWVQKIHESGYENCKIISNLPYYITTPILLSLLRLNASWGKIVLMMQKEAAERFFSPLGAKEYGPLSLMAKYYTKAEQLFVVLPHVFLPPPNVESVVVCLDKLAETQNKAIDEDLLWQVVKAAFAQRRKTLANCLANSNLLADKTQWQPILTQCDIDGKRRGETLTLAEFVCLANQLYDKKSQ